MRHQDPNGDFGRNNRQRQVIMAILDKAASITAVTHFNTILTALGNNVTTNLTLNEMMDIEKNYRNCRNNVTEYEVKGTGVYSGGVYYLDVSKAERTKVTNMLKSNLGLS